MTVRRLASLALIAAATSSQATLLRATQPTLSPDGKTVAFSYQGDIWTAPVDGGNALRLTVNDSNEAAPRFTPDGKTIVFTSDRYGNPDVFAMNADGTNIRRLNMESSTEFPYSISPDSQSIYGYTTGFGGLDVFKLSINGGSLIRMTTGQMEREYFPFPTPDGKSIIFCSGSSSGSWRNPFAHGSNTSDLFIGANTVPVSNVRKLTSNEVMDHFPLVAPDGTIYFISNRDGWPNLWRMDAQGKGAKKLTNFADGTMRWPSISANGQAIAFEFESEIYVYDVRTMTSRKIDPHIPDDLRRNPVTQFTLSAGVDSFAFAQDGKRAMVGVRGDLYLIPGSGGTTRRLTTDLAMDDMPVFLSSDTALFTTGRTGKREIWKINTKGEQSMWAADPLLDVGNVHLSPDGKSVAYFRGQNQIVVRSADGKGEARMIVDSSFAGGVIRQDDFSWSPDSQFIGVAVPTDRGGTNILLVNVADGKSTIVAKVARDASAPVFSPDCRRIAFTAADSREQNIFVVDLTAEDIKFAEDELDNLDAPKPEEPKAKPAVRIDEAGLESRMRQLTANGGFGPIFSADGKLIFANVDGAWSMIPAAGGPASAVAGVNGPVVGTSMEPNGKIYGVNGGKLVQIQPTGLTPVSFSATAEINQRDEEQALFKEIWWAMDRFYYNPAMNNRGWEQIRDKYAKIVPGATDRSDFYAMMGEMMEELNSSHLGATAPSEEPQALSDQTAWLGVDFDPAELDRSGKAVVAVVIGDSPADHPKSKLMVGDQIAKINGVAISPTNTPTSLLRNQVGKKTVLSVLRDGKEVTVTIKPASPGARAGLMQADWVRRNREMVDKLSGGKIAYHYYASMNDASQAKFVREIRTQTQGKQALIIDVRFNGGGSTAQQALGVLIKTPWLIRTRRDAPHQKMSENIYRGDSLELPSCLMTNQYSFSNAEIFSEGFRRLKVGPIIGVATAGGVIGTSSYSLWDGGQIRMPASGAYAVDGENLEGNGRRTDINVPWDINAANAGRDVQLEAAVKEMLKRIKA